MIALFLGVLRKINPKTKEYGVRSSAGIVGRCPVLDRTHFMTTYKTVVDRVNSNDYVTNNSPIKNCAFDPDR